MAWISSRVKPFDPIQSIPYFTLFFLLHLCWTVVTAGTSGSSGRLNKVMEGVIVPGLYIQELDDSPFIPYENLIPLLFEFKLGPGLRQSSVPSPPPTSSNLGHLLNPVLCRSEAPLTSPYISTYDWLFSCPVFYGLNRILNSLRSNVSRDLFPRIGEGRVNSEFLKFGNPQLGFPECAGASRAWRGINSRDSGLSEYMSLLDKCALTSYVDEGITEFSTGSEFNLRQFERIRDNFVAGFGNQSIGAQNSGDFVNIVVGLQGLLTATFLEDARRWERAGVSCGSQRIPASILTWARLERVISEVRSKLGKLKPRMSLVTNSLSTLYQLPIADCIFGSGSIFVRILLPVRRENRAIRPLTLHAPPFLYDGGWICTVGPTLTQRTFLYDRIGRTLMDTGCEVERGGLCPFSTSEGSGSRRSSGDKCVRAVLANSFPGIRAHCGIQCERLGQGQADPPGMTLPLIQRVDSDKFLITSNVFSTLLVKCEREGILDQLIPPQDHGGIEVILPCHCYLMFHASKFEAQEPCGSNQGSATILHAVPIQMVNGTLEVPMGRGYFSPRFRQAMGPRGSPTVSNLTQYLNLTFLEEVKVPGPLVAPQFQAYLDEQIDGNGSSTASERMGASEGPSTTLACVEGNGGHGLLWAFVLAQGFTLVLLIGYLFVKLWGLTKALENSRRSHISFNVAHPSQVELQEEKY